MTHACRTFLTFFFYCLLTATLSAQTEDGHDHAHDAPALQFIANQRQWDDRIAYAAGLGGLNKLLLEEDRFTFVLFDPEQSNTLHDRMQALPGQDVDKSISGHAYSVRFNGIASPDFSTDHTAEITHNYLLGNDPSRWAKNVPLHGKVTYENLYPGVDLDAYSHAGNFKYDFVIDAGADPDKISFRYEGLDGIRLAEGDLVLVTSVGELRELAPYAYQKINGHNVAVACAYRLDGTTVSFDFPDGYDATRPLIIDPTVVGATLAGSLGSEAFGHSATSDNAGNMYGAGISFGVGYPTTMGAFQQNFAGGNVDMAVTKYNPEGTTQLYATYIGGSNSDYPQSMIVDANGQLSLYGTSVSTNFPTTPNAVQPNSGGGTDIVVAKLSPDGSTLVGATYLGGGNVDGINASGNNIGGGDQYRGEIVLDAQGNIYIASCSRSQDFPVTSNALQTIRGSGSGNSAQDGIVAKLNSDLSTLFWSTYLGGAGADLASSLRVDDGNTVYVSGFAASPSFPMVDTPLLNHPGGSESAFIVRIAADGSQLLNGTFWGTGENDRSYFLDTDELNQVHIFGLSQGDMPVTADVYSTPGGGRQFVSGFTADLSQNIYSTVIGNGNSFNNYSFLPVAFMVDKCNGIYVSGHSARENLPLTDDAVYELDNSFYLAKLEPDAVALTFGSYYGRANHVDGGTSRFDKGGIVYQGVCSCTDGGRVMNTTAGAFRENQTERCDIGVFKIDFDVDVVTAQGVAAPSTSGCAPLTIDFEYTGRDAQIVTWDFGTGDTGDGYNFTYTFDEPGIYTVEQIASSPSSCNPTDTFYLEIVVLDDNSTMTDLTFCAGQDITFLDASTPGATYTWQDGTTAATYQPVDAGIYWVDVSIEGCTRRDSFDLVALSALSVDLGEDFTLCDEDAYVLDATNPSAVSYRWQDNSDQPTLTAAGNGVYAVTVTDANGCFVEDLITIRFSESAVFDLGDDQTVCDGETATLSADVPGATFRWQDGSTANAFSVTEDGQYFVEVLRDGCTSSDTVSVAFADVPVFSVTGLDTICPAASDGSLLVSPTSGGTSFAYAWADGPTAANRNDLGPGEYTVTVTNEDNCATTASREVIMTDSVRFDVMTEEVPCFEEFGGALRLANFSGGTPPYRYAIDGAAYDTLTLFEGLAGGTYELYVIDGRGCTLSRPADVVAPRNITIDAGSDQLIRYGDSIQLRPEANVFDGLGLTWSPTPDLNCTDCPEPFAHPLGSRNTFTLTAVDSLSGCVYRDSLLIRVSQERNVYVPNAFSPNGDGVNDRFFANTDQSVSRINYLRVYGRWGQLVFEGNDLRPNDPAAGWDGTINGRPTGDQVFAYVMEVVYLDNTTKIFRGDVTLMR